MAAEYEVNIKLNSGKAKDELKQLDSTVKKIQKTEKKSANTTDRRKAALIKLRDVGSQIQTLEDKGLKIAKAKFQLKEAGKNIEKGELAAAGQRMQILNKEISAQKKLTNELKRQAEARKRKKSQRRESVALGLGFPLLFGGGAGSVLGGGIGGLTGSFGAQIAFSAIGQQIDQFVASVINTGKAFTSVGTAADFMAEKSLFSSDAIQSRIESLIEEGNATEAAALMTKEMAKVVGGNGLKALVSLGNEANEMGKLFGILTTQVGAFIAQGLAPLLRGINNFLGGIALNNQFRVLREEATGARAKEIEDFLKPFTKKIGGQGGAKKRTRITDEGKRLAVEKFGGQFIPKGAEITPTNLEFRAPKTNAAAEKARREEERLQKRLAKLDQERLKVIEISRFKEKIALAEAAGDAQRVIRLQGEQRLAEIEQRRLDKLIGVTNQQEIQKINSLALARTQAAQLETDRKLTEEQRKRQEFFDNTVQGLEHQLALTTATTETEREQLRIQERLRKLGEDNNLSDSQLSRVGGLMQQLSEANSPINKFITQSVNSLNNLEQRAVQVSQSIGSAIGSSLVNGLQGLITGAQSVKEVFANMLKSIANILAEQAAQMIGTYIAIGIARLFAGMGSKGGPDPNSAGVGSVLQGGGFTTGNMADQAVAGTFTYAQGGYVSRPTNALIGEGGEPEYVIPESKMRTAMSRYSRGSRGNSVIPESGATEAMGGGSGTAVAAPIDVRYTVERINSIDYVTADQFQTGMQQAAQQGAKQGEQQTLKRLQMSGSTRKRIGI